MGSRFKETSIWALILTMIWFLGPLVQYYFETKLRGGFVKEIKEIGISFLDITTWRNVFVAPVAEELVFRGLVKKFLFTNFFH